MSEFNPNNDNVSENTAVPETNSTAEPISSAFVETERTAPAEATDSLCRCDNPDCPVKKMTSAEISALTSLIGIGNPNASTQGLDESSDDFIQRKHGDMLAEGLVLITRQYRSSGIRLVYAPKEDADSASAIFSIRGLSPVNVYSSFRPAVEKLELYDFPVNGLKAIDEDQTSSSSSTIERGVTESEDDYIQRIHSEQLALGNVLVIRSIGAQDIFIGYIPQTEADALTSVIGMIASNGVPILVPLSMRSAVEKLDLYDFPVNGLEGVDSTDDSPSSSGSSTDCFCGSPDCPVGKRARANRTASEDAPETTREAIDPADTTGDAVYDLLTKMMGMSTSDLLKPQTDFQIMYDKVNAVLKPLDNEDSNDYDTYLTRVDSGLRELGLVPVVRTLQVKPGSIMSMLTPDIKICYVKQEACDNPDLTQDELDDTSAWPIVAPFSKISSMLKIELYEFPNNDLKSVDELDDMPSAIVESPETASAGEVDGTDDTTSPSNSSSSDVPAYAPTELTAEPTTEPTTEPTPEPTTEPTPEPTADSLFYSLLSTFLGTATSAAPEAEDTDADADADAAENAE
jgi:hypothetical protein